MNNSVCFPKKKRKTFKDIANKEASSHDQINMTELRLEYDQKMFTMMNINIGYFNWQYPRILEINVTNNRHFASVYLLG